jgi:ribose-phosphate pyrophosphokinase
MVELNLVHKNKSEVEYTVSNFPDTQKQIKIEIFCSLNLHNSAYDKIVNEGVVIKSRMSWDDVQLIIATVKALRQLKAKEIHLCVPYFLGARSDRKFEQGSNNYLKDVICPIINSLELDSVSVLDAHSFVLEACLKNFQSVDNYQLVRYAQNDLLKKNVDAGKSTHLNDFILVAPDAGASHKIYKLAENIGYKGEIIICSKERGTDGKLSKTVVPDFDYSKDIVIVDDIFDYGNTFMNIVKAVSHKTNESVSPIGKKYLIVTHAIQEKGLEAASEYFNTIYTTNSVREFDLPKVKILDIF